MSDTPTITAFAATGTIASFVVQATGTYYLYAEGAEAGDSGGDGGFAGGDFYLTQGETLLVAVALEGAARSHMNDETSGTADGGGGGDSFIVLAGGVDIPLLVAGEGGSGGLVGTAGAAIGGSGQGSSGAGFFSNGAGTCSYRPFPNGLEITGSGAQDFANGLAGGSVNVYALGLPEEEIIGGFGGGGGGSGGGYTGGDPAQGGTS